MCIGVLAALLAMSGPVVADGEESLWHWGAYLDLSWAADPEHAGSRPWRSHGTSSHIDEFGANVGLLQLRKDVHKNSPWGMELGFQGGWDTESQLPTELPGRDRRIDGADTLRHVARANLSYLVPDGNGLLFTAGLMNSFIGYESFYAKDNFNYTRSYIAEYSPYFLIGAGARYPLTRTLNGSVYIVNGYNHLSHPNDTPSLAGQLAWQLTPRWSFTQNAYVGSDQERTGIAYWRLFSDSIIQWQGDNSTIAVAVDVGSERMGERSGGPRSYWLGGALFTQWRLSDHWNVAVRPEVYWDPNGRLTGAQQLLKAITATGEYVTRVQRSTVRLRFEYRCDHATGRQGGFFVAPLDDAAGNPPLTRTQHLFLMALLLSFDT